jgi:uncharacterized protein (UPF0332 family)
LTEANIRINVREEIVRAEECLKEPNTLEHAGFYAGGVSRLYYAVFHSLRALLIGKGLEPKTHEGALRLLGLHFIKTGILDTEISHIFARLMKYREEADYNPSYTFTEKDYVSFKKEADLLCTRVREFLKKEGMI